MTKAANSTWRSCLYRGVVSHTRFRPVGISFRYRLFMLYLDLDELPQLFEGSWLWSVDRSNVASFWRADHLCHSRLPLKEAARDLVEEKLGFRPMGPIRLLTHLRYFGFMMNPVSFYFCYASEGDQPVAMIAEVNNTPWREQHCYVFPWSSQDQLQPQSWRNEKEFHVSPFMEMAMQYAWTVHEPAQKLSLSIENYDAEGLLFAARLAMTRREITSWSLASHLLRFPAITLKVYGAIHWQALKLWGRGVAYVPHPGSLRHPEDDNQSSICGDGSSTGSGIGSFSDPEAR